MFNQTVKETEGLSPDILNLRESLIRVIQSTHPQEDPAQLLLRVARCDLSSSQSDRSSPLSTPPSSPLEPPENLQGSSDSPTIHPVNGVNEPHIYLSQTEDFVATLKRLTRDHHGDRSKGYLLIQLPTTQKITTTARKETVTVNRGQVHHQHLAETAVPGILRGQDKNVVHLDDERTVDFTFSQYSHMEAQRASNLYDLFCRTVERARSSTGRYLIAASHKFEYRQRMGFSSTSVLEPGNRLLTTKRHYPGIHSPYTYVSLPDPSIESITYSAMHREDFGLHSANVLYAGAPKAWLIVHPDYRERLERKVREHFPSVGMKSCSQFLRHENLIIHPDTLKKWDIEFSIVLQEPSTMVVTMPNSYHQVFNQGTNQAEAINLTLDIDWEVDPFYVDCSVHHRSSHGDPPMTNYGMAMLSEPRSLDVLDPDEPPDVERLDRRLRQSKGKGRRKNLAFRCPDRAAPKNDSVPSKRRKSTRKGQVVAEEQDPITSVGSNPLARDDGESASDSSSTAIVQENSHLSSDCNLSNSQEGDTLAAENRKRLSENETDDLSIKRIKHLGSFYPVDDDNWQSSKSNQDRPVTDCVRILEKVGELWIQTYKSGLQDYKIAECDAFRVLLLVHAVGNPEVFCGLQGLISTQRNISINNKTAQGTYLNYGLIRACGSKLKLQRRIAAFKIYTEFKALEEQHSQRIKLARYSRNDRSIERGPTGLSAATFAYKDLYESIYGHTTDGLPRGLQKMCCEGKQFSTFANEVPETIVMLLPLTKMKSTLHDCEYITPDMQVHSCSADATL
ncbi:MAG: hypothetical protein M1814_000903 [Vezdaea aestivalis]|nr:MAG: hypothetical protein M1814_000903 [Vezdaea aestivalis]